jgi:imidazolonepropionase-like amidohydrolase
MRTVCFALFVIAASMAGNSFADPALYDLMIRNVTTIDPVAGQRDNQSVFVKDNKIVAVIDSPQISASSVSGETAGNLIAANMIDGSGRFLIPGLWDMHVHIVYEPRLIEQMPALFLDYGITSVRDTGALLGKISPEIDRWRELGSDAPDIFFSGPLLDGSLVVYNGEGRPEIGVANSTASIAEAQIKKLKAAGVDFIKIYELVKPDVFQAMVDAATREQLPIAAHIPLSMRANTAGPLVDSMEHLRNIEIACADNADELHGLRTHTLDQPGTRSGHEVRSHLHSSQRPLALETADPKSERCQRVIQTLTNTIQVPTLRLNTITRYSPTLRNDWLIHLERLPKGLAKEWRESADYWATRPSALGYLMSDWSLGLVAAMHQQDVPIGAGTDTPIAQAIPGYSLHTELERLVDAGLTTQQALFSATIRPAEFFKLNGSMGQISAGMEADLVLLRKNPLVDIRHSRSIEAVISNGIRVR